MKRFLLMLFTVVTVFSTAMLVATNASAQTTSGTTGDCTWTLDGTVLTISGNGPMGDYALTPDDLPWGKEITEVIIQDGVTNIGMSVFNGCSKLISVTIPESVTYIRANAFDGCSNLTSITLPDSIKSIQMGAFYGCSSLANVYVSDMFAWCNIAFDIDYANPLSNGAKLCVNDEVITNIVIPEGITKIKDYAFYGCEYFESVIIPNTVTSIGDYVFFGCSNLTSVIVSDSVTSIGKCAFSGCSNLTGITIPDSVTSIGLGAFNFCQSLKSITIPESVVSIGQQAFYKCSELKQVYIKSSSIAEQLFSKGSGGIEIYAETIYIMEGITEVSTLAASMPYKTEGVVVDGITYTAYSKTAPDISEQPDNEPDDKKDNNDIKIIIAIIASAAIGAGAVSLTVAVIHKKKK